MRVGFRKRCCLDTNYTIGFPTRFKHLFLRMFGRGPLNFASTSTNVAQATTTTMTYDAANRIASANVGSGTEYYSYDVWNRRIYRKRTNGTEEWTFYGARGEKLGTYGLTLVCDDWNDPNTCRYESALQTTNIWFGSKLIWSGTGAANTSGPVFADRLGTNRANGTRFRPYGDEITT